MDTPAAIEEEHEALLQFLYIVPVGLVQARTDGEILLVNAMSAQLLMPVSPDGQLDNLFRVFDALAPDLRNRVASFAAPHGTIVDAMQLPLPANPPTRRQPQVLSLTVLKLDGDRLMAVVSDVTASVRRDRDLRQHQVWISSLATGMTDYALVALDPQGRIRDWNPGIGRITGFDADAAVAAGQSCAMFYLADGMTPERLADRLADADRTGWSLDEGWRLRADGSRYWGSCLIAPLQAGDGADASAGGYTLILRDISDRREAHEALRQSIACDHLTGLSNRRAFFEAAEIELQRWHRFARPLSLVMIDADHFKRINDRHGHAAGDAVLRHLAAALAAQCRGIDVAARLGGEEFVLLLPGRTVEVAHSLAERLRTHLVTNPAHVDGIPIRCSISAGVTSMEAGVADVQALLQRADAALYAAKAAGRNQVQIWHGDPPAGRV